MPIAATAALLPNDQARVRCCTFLCERAPGTSLPALFRGFGWRVVPLGHGFFRVDVPAPPHGAANAGRTAPAIAERLDRRRLALHTAGDAGAWQARVSDCVKRDPGLSPVPLARAFLRAVSGAAKDERFCSRGTGRVLDVVMPQVEGSTVCTDGATPEEHLSAVRVFCERLTGFARAVARLQCDKGAPGAVRLLSLQVRFGRRLRASDFRTHLRSFAESTDRWFRWSPPVLIRGGVAQLHGFDRATHQATSVEFTVTGFQALLPREQAAWAFHRLFASPNIASLPEGELFLAGSPLRDLLGDVLAETGHS